ncbi:hypothetical protein C9I92_09200 [Photobacterium ganghwense]|uniref:Membrane protein n=1 Tax=Photobacterium ganghwense TaxID=320778 RepID=A0A0J1K7V8_9GAMM|nr:hypothetical protein [Photobacterium ganghwense]KLV10422.1 membrane protein [Photobacterium ganghwense]PSU09682.1 hypothetical protein C9I92_09200 [Photobacterium ganghwense]QSV16929.1 hypothetical protein FH974_18410 [Photobacterium ganghwense]
MQQDLLIIFAAVWLGMALGSFMLFHRGKDVAKKRKLWPVYTIVSNVVIAAVIVYMQPPFTMMLGLLAFMVPLTWLTIRSTRFCDACAHPSRSPFFMKPPSTCSHCKKPLH